MRRAMLALAMVLVCGLTLVAQRPAEAVAATNCNCKLHCGNGTWYQLWASSAEACRLAFESTSFCSGWGDYSYTSNPSGFPGCPMFAEPTSPDA